MAKRTFCRTSVLRASVVTSLLGLAVRAEGGQTPAAENWWSRSFSARRALTFEREPSRGEPVLLVLGTAGLTRPDCRDLRVVADGRVQLPIEVIEVGPGDLATLAFEYPEPGHALHAYLGCPHADPPRRPGRDFRGGLRLEIRALPPGEAGSWADAGKLLKASGDPLGVLFPDTASLGVPPLGRTKDFIARYLGWIRVEKGGEHAFETASDGASFALVDGKVAAEWPGFHGAGGHGDPKARKEHSGKVALTPGLHAVEYLVATKGGGPHVLGIAGPGDAFVRPVPPERWVRWARARPGPLELPGEAAADFSWKPVSDTGSDADRHELALLEFSWSGGLAGRALQDVEWDFGDGQKGRGETVRHLYLGHGTFEVAASARVGAGKVLEAKRRVAVRFVSLRVADLNRILEEYHRIAKGYDLAALPEDHLERLVWLSKKDFSWEESLARTVDAYFERGFSLGRGAMAREGIRRARRLVQEREGFDRAEPVLARIAKEAPNADDRRDAAVWLARSWTLRPEGAKPAEAEEALRKIRAEAGASDPGRRAGIFLADLLLSRGKVEEGERLLGEMEEGAYKRFEGERQVASGAHALAFDNLLKRGDARDARDELERWDWELPRDRLAGHIQLRRAALYRSEKKLDAALRELEQVLALRGASNQVPRALVLIAEVFLERGDKAGAKARLDRVIAEFPERPERKEAEGLRDKIGS
jgi:tetratricopeptide (TPR) repeat protein